MRLRFPAYCLLMTVVCLPMYAVDLPPPAAPTTPAPPTMLPSPNQAPMWLPQSKVDARVDGDAVTGFRINRLDQQDPDAAYPHPYAPIVDSKVMELPAPIPSQTGTRYLTLKDAIAIALRNNPNVQVAELQRILDKFGMETQIHDRYDVQWQPLTASATANQGGAPTYASQIGATVQTLEGTTVSTTYANSLTGGPGTGTLSVTQPLLQNFGQEYNRIIYDNAVDNEAIAKLNFKSNIINSVVMVIETYRALVASYANLDLSKQSLASQEESLKQTAIQVQVGQMAQSDLVQQQANVESTRLSVVQQENQLRDAYQAFLSSLGLIPSASIEIDRTIDVAKKEEEIPTKAQSIAIALENNIPYQQALIQLRITERQLINAENTQKWSLNLTGSYAIGQNNGGSTPNATTGIALSVPIDNVDNQSGVVSAKVAIEDAKINLQQTKENLVRTVTDQWEGIQNQYKQIHISEVAVQMQEQTVKNAELQLRYGKASVFEVNTLQTQLLQQQISLVTTEISFLDAVTQLSQTLGTTLDNRHVKLRY